MIKSLKVHNFKSWRDIGPLPIAPLTALFGPNSAGKSSLFQLLLMLKQTVESTDRTQVLHLGDDRSPVTLGTFEDVIYSHNPDASLSWELRVTLPKELRIVDPARRSATLFEGDELIFTAEIIQGTGSRLQVVGMTYTFSDHSFSMRRKGTSGTKYTLSAEGSNFRLVRTPGRVWDLPAPARFYGFPDQVKAYFQNAGFLADLELAFEEHFNHTYYLGPLREYPKRQYAWAGAQPSDMGQRGEKVVDAILASRERGVRISRGAGKKKLTVEEYVALWLRDLGLIHSFSIEPITEGSNLFQVWVQKTPSAPRVLITDVGFGVSQILPVIAPCYYVPEGSTILLEQPEIHLHPSVQAGLADVFIDALRVRHVQILVESHSEHLLRRLQRRVAEERLPPESVELYFCSFLEGESTVMPLELDMFGQIANWPEGFFGDEFSEMAATAEAVARRKLE